MRSRNLKNKFLIIWILTFHEFLLSLWWWHDRSNNCSNLANKLASVIIKCDNSNLLSNRHYYSLSLQIWYDQIFVFWKISHAHHLTVRFSTSYWTWWHRVEVYVTCNELFFIDNFTEYFFLRLYEVSNKVNHYF